MELKGATLAVLFAALFTRPAGSSKPETGPDMQKFKDRASGMLQQLDYTAPPPPIPKYKPFGEVDPKPTVPVEQEVSKSKLVMLKYNGCTDALYEFVPENDRASLECPEVYKVEVGFKPKVSNPDLEPLLEKTVHDIDRAIDTLGHPYSYPLLHAHPLYPQAVETSTKRLLDKASYLPVEGEPDLSELRTYLEALDWRVDRRDAALKKFETEFIKKYNLGSLGVRLELMPYSLYSGSVPFIPPTAKEAARGIPRDNAFLSSPLGTELCEEHIKLHQEAHNRIKSEFYANLDKQWAAEGGKGKLTPEVHHWSLRMKSFDEAVMKRYKTWQFYRQVFG